MWPHPLVAIINSHASSNLLQYFFRKWRTHKVLLERYASGQSKASMVRDNVERDEVKMVARAAPAGMVTVEESRMSPAIVITPNESDATHDDTGKGFSDDLTGESSEVVTASTESSMPSGDVTADDASSQQESNN